MAGFTLQFHATVARFDNWDDVYDIGTYTMNFVDSKDPFPWTGSNKTVYGASWIEEVTDDSPVLMGGTQIIAPNASHFYDYMELQMYCYSIPVRIPDAYANASYIIKLTQGNHMLLSSALSASNPCSRWYCIYKDTSQNVGFFDGGGTHNYLNVSNGIGIVFCENIVDDVIASTKYRNFVIEARSVNSSSRYGYLVYQNSWLNFSTSVMTFLNELTRGITPSVDPYDAGGTSQTGGGEGDFDGTSDEIDFPPLPTIGAVDTGFITLYNPTLLEVQNLASYMWSGLFDIATFRKLFADPMDAIIGFSIVPVAVPDGTSREVTVGNIPTGIYMTPAASQFVEVDCGTLNVNEYWGAYLDYEPYTKAQIYLPFIGFQTLNVDDIMGKAVSVKYHVDIFSGACVAYVKCGDAILYTYAGQCAAQIPITSNDWTQMISAALSLAASIGTTVATGGLSAPATMAGVAEAAGAVSGWASSANQIKPGIQRSGAVSGTSGFLSVMTPYIVLTRPRQALPEAQNELLGYPSLITETLGDLTGFTMIEDVHLSGIEATSGEIAEILQLLKTGVIL